MPQTKEEKKTANLHSLFKQTYFNENYVQIFKDFDAGMTAQEMSMKHGVHRQTIWLWRKPYKAYIDFSTDEPALITTMKQEVRVRVNNESKLKTISSKAAEEKIGKEIATIENMREKGLKIVNMALERAEELIAKEKDVKKLASMLSAVLPYVAVRKESATDKKHSNEDRRQNFIQNVMNVFKVDLSNQDLKVLDVPAEEIDAEEEEFEEDEL